MSRIKLCGMTRAEDVAAAVEAGADYVGVIFAGGPRHLTAERARDVVAPARGRARVVGVFGPQPPAEIASVAQAVSLDVVQLHADPDVAAIEAVRGAFSGPVWAALRIADSFPSDRAAGLFRAADGVVLDARVAGALGGTGRTLDWGRLALQLARVRGARALLVLAGGLTPDNVSEAVQLLTPDVVDVSSGIERSPGIKDHDQVRAFVDRARTAAIAPRG